MQYILARIENFYFFDCLDSVVQVLPSLVAGRENRTILLRIFLLLVFFDDNDFFRCGTEQSILAVNLFQILDFLHIIVIVFIFLGFVL